MNPLQFLWDRDIDYLDWISNNKEKSVFIGIVLLGIAVFLFNLFILPETSFQDSVFYLNMTKDLMEGKALEYPFPLKFYLTAAFFYLVPLPIEQFSKLVPLIISVTYFFILYKLGRQLFRKHFIFPLAFTLTSYWILNFFSINYNGPLVALFVLAFCYLYLIETRKVTNDLTSNLNFVLMPLLIIGMALTKMNGLAIAPILLVFLLLLYYKQRGLSVKSLVFFILIAICFSSIYLLYSNHYEILINYQTRIWNDIDSLLPKAGEYLSHAFYAYLHLFNYPPNECLNQIIFGAANEPLKLIFIIITAPLFFLCITGILRGLFKGNLFWKMLSCVVIFNFGIIGLQYLSLTPFILPRYLIPTIALAGILTAREYSKVKRPWIKKAVLISFVLFAAYSFAYSGYSTYYHHKIYMLHEPAIQFVSTLPENSNILVSYQAERIKLYAHKNHSSYPNISNRGAFMQMLEDRHITHIYIGCYWERIDLNTMQMLLDANAIQEVYADKCSRVYKVLYYMAVDMSLPEMQIPIDTFSPISNKIETYRTYRVDECH